MSFTNKQVYITGSGRGMGHSFAKEAASRGAHVVHLVRNPDQIDHREFTQLGAASSRAIPLDMLKRQQIDEVAQQIIESEGTIDVLINNAGLLTGGLIESQSTDDIYQAVQVNLTGLMHLTKLLIPKMVDQGSGVIVNNSSVSGKMFFPCASTYAATKAGVVAFTECIKQELEPTGVKTLLLITAGVKTDMFDQIEGYYGNNLKLDFMKSIRSEDWATQVFDAIESGKDTLMPPGSSSFGVRLGHHLPGVFQSLVRSKFQR